MNDKPILYEDKIKNKDNEFLYNKCVNQYHQLMNCQYKNKEYKNKINNLQFKIDKINELLEERKKEVEDISWVEMKVEDYIEEINEIEDILKEDK